MLLLGNMAAGLVPATAGLDWAGSVTRQRWACGTRWLWPAGLGTAALTAGPCGTTLLAAPLTACASRGPGPEPCQRGLTSRCPESTGRKRGRLGRLLSCGESSANRAVFGVNPHPQEEAGLLRRLRVKERLRAAGLGPLWSGPTCSPSAAGLCDSSEALLLPAQLMELSRPLRPRLPG